MKQGTGNRTGGQQKVEPRNQFVNPGAVSYMGNKLGNHADNRDMTLRPTPYNAGRGANAPSIGVTTHKNGTQGKH